MYTHKQNNDVNPKATESIVKRLLDIQKGGNWINKLGKPISIEKMSNKKMAAKLGISQVRYSKIVHGKTSLTIDDFLNIISVFKVYPQWVLIGQASERPFYLVELSSLIVSLAYKKKIPSTEVFNELIKMYEDHAQISNSPEPIPDCCSEEQIIKRIEDFRAADQSVKSIFTLVADGSISKREMASYLGIPLYVYSKIISNSSLETRKLHLENLWKLITEFSDLQPEDYTDPYSYIENVKKFDVNYLLYGYININTYDKNILYYLKGDLEDASHVVNCFKKLIFNNCEFTKIANITETRW